MSDPQHLYIRLPKRLDCEAAWTIGAKIRRTVRRHHREENPPPMRVTMDFSGTTAIDFSGLSLIHNLLDEKSPNVRYELIEIGPKVASTLKAFRLLPASNGHGLKPWLIAGAGIPLFGFLGFMIYLVV